MTDNRADQTSGRGLFEGAPVAIVIVDDDGRVRRVNRRFTALFGYTAAEAEGRALDELIVPEHDRARGSDLEQRVRAGEDVCVDLERRRRDGSLIPVRASAARAKDSPELFVIYEDISDTVAARRALEDALASAERASETKSTFLANMSHELRTPLNSIIGFANVLAGNRSGNLGAMELSYVDRVRKNGMHLLRLINDILDLSKIEAGRMELVLTDVDPGPFIADIVDQMQQPGRPVTLRADVPPDAAPLRTDAVRLRQIITNLVGNALKFTETGSVTVRLTSVRESGRARCIEVIDTGIGIPEDRQQAVFEAFRQADDSTSRKYGGTGLGLAITRSLCELLDYRVTIESRAGHGSTFRIHLDAEAAAAPTIEPAPEPAAAAPVPARRVLVIDDDANVRILLKRMLEDADCDVLTAPAGAQGLMFARSRRPDLIVLDLMIPRLAGFEILAALQDDPVLAEIPVVVVSLVDGDRRQAHIGAAALLEREVDRADLEQILRLYLAEDPADKRAVFYALVERVLRRVEAAAAA